MYDITRDYQSFESLILWLGIILIILVILIIFVYVFYYFGKGFLKGFTQSHEKRDNSIEEEINGNVRELDSLKRQERETRNRLNKLYELRDSQK
jgi:F0F1-type ATP synthase membrane subunit b/b'